MLIDEILKRLVGETILSAEVKDGGGLVPDEIRITATDTGVFVFSTHHPDSVLCVAMEPYQGVVAAQGIDPARHRKTDKICPLCKLRRAWEHLPCWEGVTWDNHTEIHDDLPMLACWKCFHWVWKSEV